MLKNFTFFSLILVSSFINGCQGKTVDAIVTVAPGMTIKTKVKCASNWEKIEIYDEFANKYVTSREMAEFPLSLPHTKASVEQICGLKQE